MPYENNRPERGSLESQGQKPLIGMDYMKLFTDFDTRPSMVPRHAHLSRSQNLAIVRNYNFLNECVEVGVLQEAGAGLHTGRAYVAAGDGLVLAVADFYSGQDVEEAHLEQAVIMDFDVMTAPDGDTQDFKLRPVYADAQQLSLGGLEVVRYSLLRCNGTIE